jgi:hypothetical protein
MASPESPARDALGVLLADLLSDMGGQPAEQTDKQPAESDSAIGCAVSGESKPTLPTSNVSSHKPATSHKRLRSASAHDSGPLNDGNARDQPLPLPLLLLPRDGPNGHHGRRRADRDAVDDAHDQRRCKMPRLGAQVAWLLAPGLTADEKVSAVPSFSLAGRRLMLSFVHRSDSRCRCCSTSACRTSLRPMGLCLRRSTSLCALN